MGNSVVIRMPGYVRSHTMRRLAPMVLVAAASLAAAVAISMDVGVPLRDPDGVISRRPFVLFGLIFVFWLADVVPRGFKRARSRRWSDVKPAVREVIAERWSVGRAVAVLVAVFSFYATYLAYRNIKSFEPLVRVGSDWDKQLGSVDQWLFAGHDPSQLLHSLLGTGTAAYAMSMIYVAFLTFVPLSLGAALVWSRNLERGLFYALALSLNWILGAASYYVFPSVGPAFANPGAFVDLPFTSAVQLQQTLLVDRIDFLHHPAISGSQGVAAFASLHASIVFTGVLVAVILRMRPVIVRLAWVYFGLTLLSTVYLGWHYVLDDIAGIGIGLTSVGVAALALRHPLPAKEWKARLKAMAIPLNAPNLISLGRIALVPVLVAFMVARPAGSGLALAVFVLAFVSDVLDGHLARSRNLITDAGKLLDPLADKLLIISSLICLVSAERLPGWLALVIVVREAGVSLLRMGAARRGLIIAASPLGKAKMGIQALFIAILIAGADPQAPFVIALMALTAAVTVVSGLDYVINVRQRAEPASTPAVVPTTVRATGP